jgi:hypothetical protein
LRQQLVRRLGPVRLVVAVKIAAEGALGGIEDDREMIGISIVHQFQQHVGEAENGVDRRAVGPRQRRQFVEGAEDEAGAVDQVDVPGRGGGQPCGGLAQCSPAVPAPPARTKRREQYGHTTSPSGSIRR